jgi:hypothetical protein
MYRHSAQGVISSFGARFARAAALFCLLAGGPMGSIGIAQYRFDPWTSDDGLPQNSVYSILKTPDGYLWLRRWTAWSGSTA